MLMNKTTRSQKFISLSDFNVVRSIFTAAVSQHSGSPPHLSIFISVGVRPIDFEVGFFCLFFRSFFILSIWIFWNPPQAYFSIHSSEQIYSFSLHLPSEAAFCIFRGCLAPSPVASLQKQTQPAPPAVRSKSCRALASHAKKCVLHSFWFSLFHALKRWQNLSLHYVFPTDVWWSLEHSCPLASPLQPITKTEITILIIHSPWHLRKRFLLGLFRSE